MALAFQAQRMTYENNICNWTKHDIVADYIAKHLHFTFSVFNYNHVLGFLGEYLNVSCTFYWSFIDIFIMVISIGIAHNYQQINRSLEFFRGRAAQDEVWNNFRRQYNGVSELLKFVDDELGNLLVLACFNDSYFIMVQLLKATS